MKNAQMDKLSAEGRKTENHDDGIVKKSAERTLTPIKAIRAYCLECSCGSANEVRLCPITDCELYPYREGHNPNIKARTYTDEERALMRERARRLNEQQRHLPDD